MNHEILFRLARAFANKNDGKDIDQIRAQLIRFSWDGSASTEYNQHQLYGWLTTGAYQVLAKRVDKQLLAHFLDQARNIPKVSSAEPFLSDYAVFPEIERITFIAGLIMTDLVSLDDADITADVLMCLTDVLDSYLALINQSDLEHRHLCSFVIPSLFGWLRSFGRLNDGFAAYYPLEIGKVKSGHHDTIAQIGSIIDGGAAFTTKFKINTRLVDVLTQLYEYFTGEAKAEMAAFLASPGSVYDNFSDYGQIYIAELYAAIYSNQQEQQQQQHEQFRKQIESSFSTHLDTVVSLRKEASKVDLGRLKRKVRCLSACTHCLVILLPDEKSGEAFLVGQLADRLLANDSTSILVMMVPLYTRLVESIVAICARFSGLFVIGIDLIKKYLLTPAPALLKLSKSKEQAYLTIKKAGVDAFHQLIVDYEDGSQVEAQMANLTNRSVSLSQRQEQLAVSHLYEIMVSLLHISTSDTLRTNVYTTLHNQSAEKNLDKLVTLALCIAETENAATFEPPNITAEIVELACRGVMSGNPLNRLCREMPYAHCEWLLHRVVRLFNEMAEEKKKRKYDNTKLVDLVAILLERLHTEWDDFQLQASMRPLFRDFWFYCTTYGYNDAHLGHGAQLNQSIGRVAQYSPILIFDENEPMKQTLAQAAPIKMHGQVSSGELESMRQGLMVALGQRDEINRMVSTLDYSYLIYHLTVLRLERLRLNACFSQDGQQYNYEQLFGYIENQMIQRDKTVGKNCIVLFEIVHAIHRDFLLLQKEKRQLTNVDEVLMTNTQLMLIKFNSMHSSSRRLADLNLTKTFNLFAHMMWHPRVIHSELDLVDKLSATLTVNDSFTDAPELSLGPYSLKVPDNLETRQKMTQDFIKRCASFLIQALDISPVLTRSHLQEYLRVKEDQHAKLSGETKSLFDLVGLKAGDFVFGGTRNKYAGEVAFLMKMMKGQGVQKMVQQYHDCIASGVIDDINEQLYRLTALVIIHEISSNERRLLLRLISRAIIDTFDVAVMETTIQCWQWISSAKATLNDLVAIEMVAAWQGTISARLGMFSAPTKRADVLAVADPELLGPKAPQVKPHLIWIKYLQETVENVKATKSAFTRNIVSLLFHTFPTTIPGSEANKLSRDVTVAAARMELASLGITLLHGDIDLGDIERTLLRNRLYGNIFDYFCCPTQLPTQSTRQLRQDTVNVMKFYFKLRREDRHMYGPNSQYSTLNPPNCDMMSETGSTLDRNASLANGNGGGGGAGSSSHGSRSLAKTASYPRSAKGTRAPSPHQKINDGYSRKRDIMLRLIAAEIDRFQVWSSPRPDAEFDDDSQQVTKEEKDLRAKFKTHQEKATQLPDKEWKRLARIAWAISPHLACHLPSRLKQEPALIQELIRLVRRCPEAAHTIPEAVKFLVTPESVRNDAPELGSLLSWAPTDPATALSFFSQMFKPNPFTAQYAVKCLRSFDADQILFYIPQLVQALRYDTIGYVYEYLIWASKQSPLLCHQLMWNMKTNRFRDEEGEVKDDEIGDKIDSILSIIENNFGEREKEFYQRQFGFAYELTEISHRIKPMNKDNGDRKRACLAEIKKLTVPEMVYLPSNPHCVVTGINRKIGIPLQSAAKAPYLAEFEVKKIGVSALEKACANGEAEALRTLNRAKTFMQKTIFKAGDDCRQDMLALQVIEIFANAFKSVGLDVYLMPYKVVATSPGYGIIECIPDSKSRNELGKKTDETLLEIYRAQFGPENGPKFQEKRRNFIRSMAAYSLVLFILQIKDRHNGNIMIDEQGHLLHIDFGFIFESSPGGNLGWEPDMKITEEMVKLMGGSIDSKEFKWFKSLAIKAYLAVRPYQESIVSLVTLMLGTGLPCFLGQTIKQLRARFAPTMTERQAAVYLDEVIRKSTLSKWSHTYDMIQYKQQGILYA